MFQAKSEKSFFSTNQELDSLVSTVQAYWVGEFLISRTLYTSIIISFNYLIK